MDEVIATLGGDPLDVLFRVLEDNRGSVPTIYFHHDEKDMQYALRAAVHFDRLRWHRSGDSTARPRGQSASTVLRNFSRACWGVMFAMRR